MRNEDAIPIVEVYRGIGLHDQQGQARLEVVKRAIDDVFSVTDTDQLAEIALDTSWPPESRLFAYAKLEAITEIAEDEHRTRPTFDMVRVRACVSGLDSARWRDPWYYGCLLEPGPAPGEPRVKRETPLD
ncbi:hypothetical protein ACVWYH_003094 [Bradyrhizobium sp. GM24.11]